MSKITDIVAAINQIQDPKEKRKLLNYNKESKCH